MLFAACLPLTGQAEPSYRNDPQVRQAMERLRTENAAEIRLRWGDMTDLVAGGRWIGDVAFNKTALWREASWLVPGAVMSYSAGYCSLKGECTKTDWLIQVNPEKSRLDYFTTNDIVWMKGQLQPDGSVEVGKLFVVFENVRFDRLKEQLVITGNVPQAVPMRKATATEVIRVSKGVGGDPAAAAEEAKAAAAKAAEAPVQAPSPVVATAPVPVPVAVPAPPPPPPPPPPPKPATVFGPFDAAAGSYYLRKAVNLPPRAAQVEKAGDSVLVLSLQFMSDTSTPQSWAVRATDTPGLYDLLDPKTGEVRPNAKARLLADGTLEFEYNWKDQEGRFRQFTRWRVLPSALVDAGERFQIHPDGTSTRVLTYADSYALLSKESLDAEYAAYVAEKAAEEERYRRGQAMRAAMAREEAAAPAPRSFADAFASTLRSELQAKDAQQARQMAALTASVRAGEQAREPSVQRQAAAPVATPAPVVPAATSAATSSAAGKPLTFILMQPMRPGPQARINPYCFSAPITVPGPPGFNTGNGWGGSEQGAVDKAIAIIKGHYGEFVEKCRQTADGKVSLGPDGTTQYDFNTIAEPSRVERAYSGMKSRGGAVEVSVSAR